MVLRARERITCVYCGRAGRSPSREHVIPETLAGTLKIEHVCPKCNSTVGTEVDAPFTDSMFMRFVRFAFMDFLPAAAIPEFTIPADLRAARHPEVFPGTLRFSRRGIEFEPRFDKRVSGNRVTYSIPDTKKGREAFEGLRASRNRGIERSEWVDIPPGPESLAIEAEMPLPYTRQVIKMFLGFLAAVDLVDIALRPVFDPARDFLLGRISSLTGSGFEMRCALRRVPLGLAKTVGHEIGFVRKGREVVFSALLFDSVRFDMRIGDKLLVVPAVHRRYALQRRRTRIPVSLVKMGPPKIGPWQGGGTIARVWSW